VKRGDYYAASEGAELSRRSTSAADLTEIRPLARRA
jgi:hypothetical protein